MDTKVQENIAKKVIRISARDFISVPPSTNGTETDNYCEKFRRSILDQAKDYPLPVPVISISQNGSTLPFLTLKSFSLWQGKQKSKKTTALALAVAAFIRMEYDSGEKLFSGDIDGSVLFFDNEQGESYAARTMKLILKLAGMEISSKLIYCDLREFSPVERMNLIKAGIENTPTVKLVVIDGLVDLLTDFMDAGEGHAITTEILKLCSSYDIHVAGVLHQNKNDKNARAHIGTISSQKCEVEISTEVDPNDRNQSFVICVNSRGLPFEQFAIRWDKGSLPRVADEWNETKHIEAKDIRKNEASKAVMESVFTALSSFTYTEAIEKIMNTTLKSDSTAIRRLKEWLVWGWVDRGSDGNYRKNNSEGSGVTMGQIGVNDT